MMPKNRIEQIFEACLWNFRFFILLPVIFGLLSSLNFFVVGSFEILHGFRLNFCLDEGKCGKATEVVGYIIGGIDYYLIGVVLVIFSFGLYELFISQIDLRLVEEKLNVLAITSLDQLKYKLLQVIVIALVVSFFKQALKMEVTTLIDLLYLSGSILIIALSSYLMHAQSSSSKH